MAQKIEGKEERPLQTYWLKNFTAVNTVSSRIALPQDACFYDLTNAQPIGNSNLHSINDASAPIYDFGASRVYADFSLNLNNIERLQIATTDGKLWLYDVGVPGAIPEVVNSNLPLSHADGTLDIAQYDNNTSLVIDSTGYYYYTTLHGESPGGSREHGLLPISTPAAPDNTGGSPTHGNAIAVYANRVWLAQGRTLYYSAPGTAADTPAGFANFTTTAGGGWETINDSTLRSDIKALFAANGYLYVFGETSIDAISDVQTTVTAGTPSTTLTTYTRLNVSSVVGTEHVESIMAYGRLVFFANQMGVWELYGTTVQLASTDVNNTMYSGIDGTWQYLDWNHYNDAVQWINRATNIVDWQNSSQQTVQWQLGSYTPFLFKISGGQVKSNNLLCAAFLVVRKNDPVMGSGNFIVIYQGYPGNVNGDNYKWWFADWTQDIGPITHMCTSFVNYAPTLFGYIGNKLYQFFADPTSAPSARMMTALWDFGDPLTDKQALRAGIRVSLRGAVNPAMTVNLDTLVNSYPVPLGDIGAIDWVNLTEQLVPWQNNVPQPIRWDNLRNFLIYYGKAPESFSKYVGFTVRSQRGTLFEMNSFLLDYKVGARWVGD